VNDVVQQVLATERLRQEVSTSLEDLLDEATLSAEELVGMASVANQVNQGSESGGFYTALLKQSRRLQELVKLMSTNS
jgi:hypothetical protein